MKKKNLMVLSIVMIGWLLLIFFLSSQDGTQTTNLSMFWAEKAADIFYSNPTLAEIQSVHIHIRKIAHIVLFAGLGMLTYMLIAQGTCCKVKKGRIWISAVVALAFVACCGFFDEWHKQFVAGRHFQIEEAALNVWSGIVGIVVVGILIGLKKKQ